MTVDPGAITALIGAGGAVVGGFFTFVSTRKGADGVRIKALEDRFDVLASKHKLLWKYCQDLIVHINTGKPAPAPDWPAELTDID